MLQKIQTAVREWLRLVELPAGILNDSEDSLRVIFETDNALAELIVRTADCAPYRYVSFTVLDTRLEPTAGPVFCFYDEESSTIEDILRELSCGAECIRTMS